MTKHPFNEGTKLAQVFTTLADCEWHCGKHELPGTQPAKAIQIIRQHGFDIENKTIHCNVCNDRTVHRRLKSVEPNAPSFVRLQLPSTLRKRILKYYKNIEAITMRELVPNQLEVDHRFPQVRWSSDEQCVADMTDEEMKSKFQLLTRQHNLWKSRYCEHCVKTGERGTFIGIDYFYSGGHQWDDNIDPHDKKGCYGCFWYNPTKWRDTLNKKLKE